MTVLGNIVAVTSIIAVVSLIQGLNASVKRRDPQPAGADSFNIQQIPAIAQRRGRSRRVRNNPRITLDDARAIRRFSADDRRGHGAGQQRRPRSPTATSRSTASQVQGVTTEYVNFSSFDAERGRLMSPTEVERARPVDGARLADRRPAVRRRSIRSTRPSRSTACTSASSASARRRARCFGQSQDEFAVIPLGSSRCCSARGSRCR